MVRTAKKLIAVMLAAVLLMSMCVTAAYADELRAGTVAGLPEKLVVLDDNGNSVSENGEYFFEVQDMTPGENYVKNIQIMNLREDASYHNECVVTLYLDERVVYQGKVTGEGIPDVRNEPLDLGRYGPGQSRVLRAEIVWNASGNYDGAVDEGHRIYDFNGVKVVREKSGKTHIEGEVIFKWIFTAVGDAPTPSGESSGTYIDTGETITFIFAGLIIVAIGVMMLLLFVKKRKKKDNA